VAAPRRGGWVGHEDKLMPPLGELVSDLRYRVRALFARDAVERDLDDELRFHLDHEIERLVRGGMSIADARVRARLAFGHTEQIKEESRDARGVRWIETVARDLRHALRLALRQPGFSAVVALSLALGIGAAATVFDLTYDVLLAPLHVAHPEQLSVLRRAQRDGIDDRFTWDEVETLRATTGSGSFTTLRGASAIVVEAGEHRTYTNLHFVEGNYFALLGVRPLHGRLITPDDDSQGAPVVVLAEWFAQQLFPGDTNPVGKPVRIRGAAFTVVGITPRSFRGVEFPGWFTGAMPEGSIGSLGVGRDDRGERYGDGSARQSDRRTFIVVERSSAPRRVAEETLAATFRRCCTAGDAARDRLELDDMSRGIGGGKNDFRPGVRQMLGILAAGMALVLIVVCCNIASLLLVRASAREREIAVRLSLGASRARLAGQLMLESVPHALAGGLMGTIFAAWCTSLFVRSLPPDLTDAADAAEIFGFQLGPTFVFALGIAAVCAIAYSVYPALRATGQQLAQSLRLDARASRSRKQGAVTRGVVVAQVAVTAMLIAAASLLSSTLGNLTHADGGFATDHMLVANIEARSTKYEPLGAQAVHEDILRAVRSVPGVESASASTEVPVFGGSNWTVGAGVPGFEVTPDRAPSMPATAATPGHFATLGIRVLAGRDFTTGDAANAERVAIVNNAFANKFFDGRGVLDRSIGFTLSDNTFTLVRIVGIVSDAKYQDLRETIAPRVYVPMAQIPGVWHSMQLVMRTRGEPWLAVPAVMKAVDAATPGIGLRRVMDMPTVIETATVIERLGARLAFFVSLMALLLSAVGLYGVVAYGVSRRTSEIGVRLALGARARAILWLVAKETTGLVGLGVLVGIPLSFAANGALRSQLFGVSPHDPFAAFVAVSMLSVVGLAASVVPARRATRIDPKAALSAD
jgi:putative ABC transport system permease protein